MRIEAISQSVIGGRPSLCVGDVLNKALTNPQCFRFRFAVAYMRVSGLRLLYDSLLTLYNRQGSIAGAVGIDDGVTTIEALQLLVSLSSTSTLVHTVSDYIYHPKLYVIDANQSAFIIIGSANLTRDGLYRNVELATAITLDLTSSADQDVYRSYDTVLNELLDVNNPNVQPINKVTLQWLTEVTACEGDIETPDFLSPKRTPNKAVLARLKEFFPPLPVSRYPQGVQVLTTASLMVIDEKSLIQSQEVPAHGTPIVGHQESERIATREANDYQSFSPLKDPSLTTTQEPQALETSNEERHVSSKNDDFKAYDTTDVHIFDEKLIPFPSWLPIVKYLHENGPHSLEQMQVVFGEATNKIPRNMSNILARMVKSGVLKKSKRGMYQIAGQAYKEKGLPEALIRRTQKQLQRLRYLTAPEGFRKRPPTTI
jgi:HKD family nuclease